MRKFQSYFPMHNHTDYSNIRLLDCILKVPHLIDRAIEMGLPGVAITDHESLGGHIKALKHLSQLKDSAKKDLKNNINVEKNQKIIDFKLALGNEIYLCRDGVNKDNYVKGKDGFWHFILIAKDKEGHKQLRQLSSRAWDRSYTQFITRVPTYYQDLEDIILPNKGHLIASTACLGGQFPNLLKEANELNNYSKVDGFVNWCLSIFGDDFYIELQPGTSEDQQNYNMLATKYVLDRKLKTIVTTDTHYILKEDRPIHKSFLNAKDGDREVDAFYEFCYLMSEEEITDLLVQSTSSDIIEQSLDNTIEALSKISEYTLAHKQVIPRIPLDWNELSAFVTMYSISNVVLDILNKYPHINNFFHSEFEEDRFFIKKILYEGLLKDSLDDVHLKRINDECGEIWVVSEKIEERLSAYFLIIKKVIDIGWTDGDSLVGPWRGSAGALLTAFLLGIIQRDPLKSPIELPFWRCISRGRAELADRMLSA